MDTHSCNSLITDTTMFMCDGSSTETDYSRMHAMHSIAARITYLANIVLFSELESNPEAPKEDGDERACMSEWRHLQYCTFPLVQLALQLLERLRYGRQRPVVTVLHRHRGKYPPCYPTSSNPNTPMTQDCSETRSQMNVWCLHLTPSSSTTEMLNFTDSESDSASARRLRWFLLAAISVAEKLKKLPAPKSSFFKHS